MQNRRVVPNGAPNSLKINNGNTHKCRYDKGHKVYHRRRDLQAGTPSREEAMT